jgi:phosphoribosylaminoimidazole carboxylase PurE protein
MDEDRPRIEVRTGSDSDIDKIRRVYNVFDSLGISYSPEILSAHRTTRDMLDAAERLVESEYLVSLAAAGGAAHLPGMTASETQIPVVGLPVSTEYFKGQDALYSMTQMPKGIPVGVVGPDQAESAAYLAASIAYLDDANIRRAIRKKRKIEENFPQPAGLARIVGIIAPEKAYVPAAKYAETLGVIRKMDLGYREFEGLGHEMSALKNIESGGMVAVIAFGTLNDHEATNYFPKEVARRTDVPTIGLPVVSGYAGGADHIEGDVFHNMLLDTMPDEDDVGFPVAGIGVNGFTNAALYAARIAGSHFPDIHQMLFRYKEELAESVREKRRLLKKHGVSHFLKDPQ